MSDNTEKLNQEIKRLGQTTDLFANVVTRLDEISTLQKKMVEKVESNVDEVKNLLGASHQYNSTLTRLVDDIKQDKANFQMRLTNLENKMENIHSTVSSQNTRSLIILFICLVQVAILVFLFSKI